MSQPDYVAAAPGWGLSAWFPGRHREERGLRVNAVALWVD